jgi:hypothetical protein
MSAFAEPGSPPRRHHVSTAATAATAPAKSSGIAVAAGSRRRLVRLLPTLQDTHDRRRQLPPGAGIEVGMLQASRRNAAREPLAVDTRRIPHGDIHHLGYRLPVGQRPATDARDACLDEIVSNTGTASQHLLRGSIIGWGYAASGQQDGYGNHGIDLPTGHALLPNSIDATSSTSMRLPQSVASCTQGSMASPLSSRNSTPVLEREGAALFHNP